MAEEMLKRVAEDIWLNYFNEYLLAHGVISDRQYQRMCEQLAARRQKLKIKY